MSKFTLKFQGYIFFFIDDNEFSSPLTSVDRELYLHRLLNFDLNWSYYQHMRSLDRCLLPGKHAYSSQNKGSSSCFITDKVTHGVPLVFTPIGDPVYTTFSKWIDQPRYVYLFVSYQRPCSTHVRYIGIDRSLLTEYNALLLQQTARDL